MKRNVVIMAQGAESSAPLAPISACGGALMIARTIMQARELDPKCRITIVGTQALMDALNAYTLDVGSHNVYKSRSSSGLFRIGQISRDHELELHTLPDPGDSPLKGIVRFFDHRSVTIAMDALDFRPVHTVLLMGDCVYSWACLRTLFNIGVQHLTYRFAGTSSMSEIAGDIWGISWGLEVESMMMHWLKKALRRHSPEHGLRQWLMAGRQTLDAQLPSGSSVVNFAPIDDYTRDFDSDLEIRELAGVGDLAAADDALSEIAW